MQVLVSKLLASCDQFVIFVCGPWVGAKMDSLPRVFAFNALSVVQVLNVWKHKCLPLLLVVHGMIDICELLTFFVRQLLS